jgi:HEPN domain-containing protein
MTGAGPRTEHLPPSEHRRYLEKSLEFAETARAALDDERLNSAGLESVHAVISACDALTIFHLGVRSRGKDPSEVLELLRRIQLEGLDKTREQVLGVLAIKNSVEYGGEGLSVGAASRAVARAVRIVEWVSGHVGTS